jgi:two-component system, OmpR family, response regulator MprA
MRVPEKLPISRLQYLRNGGEMAAVPAYLLPFRASAYVTHIQVLMLRVLVVDNDPAIRRILQAVLSDAGFAVDTAANGFAALQAVQAERPHAIVLDLLMPGMAGREVFHRLESGGDRPPVLILSSFDAHQARDELGAEEAIEKPFEPEELVQRVQRMLSSAAGQASTGSQSK